MNSSEFFNVIDYICLLILFASVFAGFLKGFTKDFFGTCSWICSLFLSVLLAPHTVPILQENIPTLEKCAFFVKCTISLVIIFAILLIISKLIVNSLSKEVKATCLSGVDRLFGAIFGLCRGLGMILCMSILSLLFGIQQERYEIVKESKIATISYRIARNFMPEINRMVKKQDQLEKYKKRTISAGDFSNVPIKKKTEKEENDILSRFLDSIVNSFCRFRFDWKKFLSNGYGETFRNEEEKDKKHLKSILKELRERKQ